MSEGGREGGREGERKVTTARRTGEDLHPRKRGGLAVVGDGQAGRLANREGTMGSGDSCESSFNTPYL